MSLMEIKNFIGGEFSTALSNEFIENINPASGKVYATLPRSKSEDIKAAVSAAQTSYVSWSKTTTEERSAWLHKIADAIEQRLKGLAEAESKDQGKPIWLAETVDIPRSAHNFRFFANQILFPHTEAHDLSQRGFNFTLRKPVGVAGLISPWNLPLYLLTWKIAPAIACGNTVVCKPSEITPMTAFLLCEILNDVGLPRGVVNMVFGYGHEAGEALVTHPQVPLISFTGGTATGKHLSQAAAPMIKKLSLELGGKNANIIFADANLEEVIANTLRSSFLNQGEICLCGSRIFVESSLYPQFLERFVAATKKLKVGDPSDPDSFMGALVSQSHLEKVQSYVRWAQENGGTIETGLETIALPSPLLHGYFMRPTIITGLPSNCRLQQEEIFGPVVTVTPFSTEDEVIAMANGVDYGLSASLWTKDVERVHRFAHRLEVGTLWVNTWMMRDLRTPFGGMKMSGVGREGGLHSLEFFTEGTNVCIKY
jgi:aminomuconate-semialdehyde/2-hydroxymuconate-6-semialdehyde dehydrogenase